MWRDSNGAGAKISINYFNRSWYWDASSSVPVSPGSDSFTTIIQLACGSVFTVSGRDLSAVFTSTTSPDTGAYSSDTALTDSIVPNDCPAFSFAPTSGSSM